MEGNQPQEVVLPGVAVRLLAEGTRGVGRRERSPGGERGPGGDHWEGADLLNVSRPYFIKLLDQGIVPHRKVGVHRRARLTDVLRCRHAQEARSQEALDALAAHAQRLGGYEL